MGLREDSFAPGVREEADRVTGDYVRREQIGRGELPVVRYEKCGSCGGEHSPHYDCEK